MPTARLAPAPDAAVLGLSFDYHDAAAAVIVGGEIVAAAAEERFSRTKHDPSLPRRAARACLERAGVDPGQLALVVHYEKPYTKVERILASGARAGLRGLGPLVDGLAGLGTSKLWVRPRIERAMADLGHPGTPIAFCEHHLSHAAAAFHPSPFDHAAILTFDAVGEWATSSIGVGSGRHVELRETIRYPDSLGLLYSTLTSWCGFAVNDGEYKLMGLAPFGTPRYEAVLRDRVVQIGDDGAVALDLRWFAFRQGRRMGAPALAELLDGPPRAADAPLTQREADIARSAQAVVEEVVLRSAAHAREVTGERQACLAGGVALNCVANARLREVGTFDDLWVQPAAGDDGGALGAALWGWHEVLGMARPGGRRRDAMRGARLGPSHPPDDVRRWLEAEGIAHRCLTDDERAATVAAALDEGAIVGWFEGAMEFGPRALGGRSILADPRDPTMVTRINAAVKQREGFRPFAPVVLAERASDWFDLDGERPYMTETVQVAAHQRVAVDDGASADDDLSARLSQVRSTIPACTHVDGSARVQTVAPDDHPALHALLTAFEARTGCPVLLNTSFNGAGEPIVADPADALRCAARVGLDLVVLEGCLVRVADLPGAGA